MSKKKAFALRMNEDMLKAIEKWASDEFRSTNGQIEWMLMQYLKEHDRQPKKKDTSTEKKLSVTVTFLVLIFCILQVLNKLYHG